jgi:acetyl-CoA carboxylase carboxyltransferase component
MDTSADSNRSTITAPMQATVVSVLPPGTAYGTGAELVVLEAMKMEHVLAAAQAGVVHAVLVQVGETVQEDQVLLEWHVPEDDPAVSTNPATTAPPTTAPPAKPASTHAHADPDSIRPDLAEVLDRHRVGLDEARPESRARRRKTGQRTARENVADLVDAGTFVEYGPLMVAAQRRRRSIEDLIAKTPADGMIGGFGTINADLFPDRESRAIVVSYDYTVLAGTQGHQNHRKKDRLFELAERLSLPVVLFAEGGGGRPGDTDGVGVAGLDCLAFALFGKLSGTVPLVGITSGFCFAGNAALLGCCDVIIATKGANIGMGGPAMIEGGGLGVFAPTEIGPLDVQVPNGVVDLVADDEADAVRLAKKYLSYFQGALTKWEIKDQRALRTMIPENRVRAYDVRNVIDGLFDVDSVLEIRRGFGAGMVTAFARVEGRPVGVIANDPTHLGGAIDADACDKSARFQQLCDAFAIPIVFLCDTPGFMVGPESEKAAMVRKTARLFVTGGSLTVPFGTIILRKGYGLGAQAMAGGSFKAPVFTVGWPTSEFGGMGLEGAVRLGYRKELEAITDPVAREASYREMVDRMYAHGKGVSMADHFEIDDVIDPAESRKWIMAMLASAGLRATTPERKRPMVDTW